MKYEDWQKTNWDEAHKKQDVSALTGTGIGGHLHTLKVLELVKPNSSILCIGVGTGVWVNEMIEKTADVTALDITLEAAKSIKTSILFCTSPDELPTDHFDLALSLWVAPHMNNHDLQMQFNGVIPSLKKDGIFAIHYKEPIDASKPLDNMEGTNEEWKKARSASMLRRRSHFNQMVQWGGGKVVQGFYDNISHFYSIIEAIAHIKKV